MTGLETALGVGLRLVEDGVLSLPTLIERMTIGAARIFDLEAGTLAIGAPADLVAFDPGPEWTVDRAGGASKSRNTPFHGMTLKGKVSYTVVAGQVVYDHGSFAEADASSWGCSSPAWALPRVTRNDASRSALPPVNTLRAAAGAPPLTFDATLTAAASTHSRDMAVQNRPWHFGSDGSSPLVRVQRAGFTGRLLGELISETYETELETLSAWMAAPDTRLVVLDPNARLLGFSWYQEDSGKIWWTAVTGA